MFKELIKRGSISLNNSTETKEVLPNIKGENVTIIIQLTLGKEIILDHSIPKCKIKDVKIHGGDLWIDYISGDGDITSLKFSLTGNSIGDFDDKTIDFTLCKENRKQWIKLMSI